jgi:hypothetical protein
VLVHCDNIEPVFIVRPSVPETPHCCDFYDRGLLATIYRFDGSALYDGSSGLDLHERQQVASPGNEIDVVTA